ncbi:MAG: hypothetical protein K0R73_1030 [Candidatus Midichloriaceae bacterium]|nr:hypothetical protein [Candidatus Midichloriaceae bacterium]
MQVGYKPDSVLDGHLSGRLIAQPILRPTRASTPEQSVSKLTMRLFGLASGGVFHADSIARLPVSSYLTFSPLPSLAKGCIFSVALSLGFPPLEVIQHHCFCEVRTFLCNYINYSDHLPSCICHYTI